MRSRFTRWYFRKGYRVEFDPKSETFRYRCPLWIKPLLFLFSPSVYMHEKFSASLEAIRRAAEAEDECESPIDAEIFKEARERLLITNRELIENTERELKKSDEERWKAISETSYVKPDSIKDVKEFGKHRQKEKTGE